MVFRSSLQFTSASAGNGMPVAGSRANPVMMPGEFPCWPMWQTHQPGYPQALPPGMHVPQGWIPFPVPPTQEMSAIQDGINQSMETNTHTVFTSQVCLISVC